MALFFCVKQSPTWALRKTEKRKNQFSFDHFALLDDKFVNQIILLPSWESFLPLGLFKLLILCISLLSVVMHVLVRTHREGGKLANPS